MAKNTKNMKAPKTVADMIVEGLEGFADAIEASDDITELYNCHKVVLDLEPTPYDPELVLKARQTLNASQAIFAQFLGVSVKSIQAWEQGRKQPSDIACRFMDEIRESPQFWQQRLKSRVRKRPTEV